MATLFPADDSIGSDCKSCGAAITPTVKFCPECGATQTSRPAKAAAPSVPSEEPPFTHHTPALTSDDESLHQPSQPRSLASHRPLWLGIAVVVIAIVSVGSWAWLSKPPTTAKAQYELGKRYYSGTGVKKDVAQAVAWYRKAADQGDATAQSALGDAYMEGNGVQSDRTEAVKWFRKAADQGNARAQYSLAICLEDGMGIQQDNAQAIVWYQKAAAQGYEDAKEPLSRLLAKQQAAEPQAASPEQNTVAERVRTEQADAVKSKLSCNSERPLQDGRSLVMDVVRQGKQLRVTQYAVNGPGNLDPLFTFLFTQDDEGHWVSYQAATKTEATIMFDDNYGNVGQYIGWNFYIAKYNDNTKLYSDLVGDAKGKCYRN
jgi:predicted RNA-binding Zn-ribbon protein involved in translation (DUF1610 family)